jgi:hypothetical protein
LQNGTFYPISVLGSNFNPRNIQYIPAVEIFAFLEREQKLPFFKGLATKPLLVEIFLECQLPLLRTPIPIMVTSPRQISPTALKIIVCSSVFSAI